MTLVPAIFGIESGALNTIVQLTLLAVVVVWLALVWYTLADAKRRLDDQMLVGSAVLASLMFPFLGTIVYMIVRPPEYLEDVRERELEMQAAEARLASLDHQLCPHCDATVGRDFLRCPHCLRKLRDTCTACARPLDPDWMICPYCEAEIPGVTPQRRRRRRRSEGEDPSYDEAAMTSQAPPGYGEQATEAYGEQATEAYAEQATEAYAEQATEAYAELPASAAEGTVIAGTPGETYEEAPWSDAPDQAPGAPPSQHQ